MDQTPRDLSRSDLVEVVQAALAAQPPKHGFFEENKKPILWAVGAFLLTFGAMQRDIFFANETRQTAANNQRTLEVTQAQILTRLDELTIKVGSLERKLEESTESRYTPEDAARDRAAADAAHELLWSRLDKHEILLDEIK